MEKIKNITFFLQKKPFLGSFLLLAFTFGFVSTCLYTTFHTNDDVMMLMATSGAFDGIPNEYLILSNIFIGKFIKLCYLFFPKINCYTIFHYALNFLALQFVMLAFFKRIKNIKALFAVIGLFLFVFVVRIFHEIQFTTTAFTCLFAALIGFYDYFEREKSRLSLFIACIFLAMSLLIRIEMLPLTILLLLPFLFFHYKKIYAVNFSFLAAISLTYLFIFALHTIHLQQYELEMPHYNAFMAAARKVMDYGVKIKIEANVPSLWSVSDNILFDCWYWLDDFLNVEKIATLVTKEGFFGRNFSDLLYNFVTSGLRYSPYSLLLALLVYLLLKKINFYYFINL